MTDELAEHLNALARDDCYRVDAVLKDGAFETTQRVFFVGANGAEQGPYVRKYLDGNMGLGGAYERMWNAQRAGGRFLHLPHIVDCYRVGDRRAVVMEFVSGETLADAVHRCGPSVELACDVFPRLCEAAMELHERFDPPIIHRDLKPANVMLARDSLTIIDFGISRTYDGEADTDTLHFGTRDYAPPEQFGFGQTDVRSDVYALGMLLFFCLTGQDPDAKVRNAGFASPLVPEVLRKIIARAAAFDPSQRYESAKALQLAVRAAAIEEKLAGASAEESAMGAPPVASRPSSQAGASTVSGRVPSSSSAAPAVAESPAMRTGFVVSASPAAPMSASPARSATRVRRRGRMRELLSRVPFSVGVAWDVALLLPFILFCIGAVGVTFDASHASAQYAAAPLWLRAVSYGSLALLMMGPLTFLLMDWRPVERLIKPFSHIPHKRVRIACLIVFVVGTGVFIATGQLFPPIDSV